MTNRRTSVYTIRTASSLDLDDLRVGLLRQGIGVADHGEASISFRTTDDTAALRIAREAWGTSDSSVWELTTGLGAHRRTVEPHGVS